jgi:hypothetical protein
MSNGRIIDPRMDAVAQAAMKAPQPQPMQIDPAQAFAQYFGLSIPALRELGLAVEDCPCGQCTGQRVAPTHALHFVIKGGSPRPETISRAARPGLAIKPTNPAEASKLT